MRKKTFRKPMMRGLCFVIMLILFTCTSKAQNIVVTAINAPISGCNIGTQTVSITFKNNSLVSLSNVALEYYVDGVLKGTGTYTSGLVIAGSSGSFSFPTTFNFAGRAAPYVLKACASGASGCLSANIQSDPVTVGGTVNSSANACKGANTGTLTLTGQTPSGVITKWQSSTDNFSSVITDIVNTTTTQTYTNLTVNTWYRAVVSSGACGTTNSSVAAITIDPTSVGGTVTPTLSTICNDGSTTVSLTLGGQVGTISNWESSTDQVAWTAIANTTTALITPTLAVTTYYRAQVKSGTCSAVPSTTATVIVNQPNTNNTIGANQIICSGSTPAALTGSAPTGGNGVYTFKWQSASGLAGPYADIPGATASVYAPGALSTTTYYQRIVTSGVCASSTSNQVTITVNQPIANNAVSSNQTVCNDGTLAAPLTGTTPTNGNGIYTYQWQSASALGGPYSDIPGATAFVYSPGALTTNTFYQRNVFSPPCTQNTSNQISITVNQPIATNTIAGNQTICAGSTPVAFTGSAPTGGNGAYTFKWQSASALAGPYADIPGATASVYAPGALSTTTYYQRIVTSGVCASSTSNQITITVNQPIANNTISANQTVCNGTAPASFTGSAPTNGNGAYTYQWQSASALAGPYSDIGGATASFYSPAASATNTYYQRIVFSAPCTQSISNQITITVDQPITNNTISANQTVCTGTTPAALTGTTAGGGNGAFTYLWESSTTGPASGFSPASGVNNFPTSYTVGTATVTAWYRRTVTSGSCAADVSIPIQITVEQNIANNTISSNQTLCSGTAASILSGSGTPTGGNGSYTYQWESSSAAVGTYNPIATATDATYDPGTLSAAVPTSTYYKRVVTAGTCAASVSNVVQINIDPQSDASASSISVISGANPMCSGNSITLSLGGTHVGTITGWESSTDNFATVINALGNAGSSTMAIPALNATNQFRVVVQSGSCPATYSPTYTVTVTPPSNGGTISSNIGSFFCASPSPSGTLTLGSYVGGVVQWEQSTNGGAFAVLAANTTPTQTFGPLTTGTYAYKAKVQSGTCPYDYSATISIVVSNAISGGIASIGGASAATSCAGSANTLSLTGQVGNVAQWESSPDAASWTAIPASALTSINVSPTITTYYRANVQGCATTSYSNTVTVNTVMAPVGGSISPAATSTCASTSTGTLTLNYPIASGSVAQWELSRDNGLTWSVLTSTAGVISYVYNVPAGNNLFRALVQNAPCASAYSAIASVNVYQPVQAGYITNTGTATYCSPSPAGALVLNNSVGSVNWKSSTNGGATWASTGNTTTAQAYAGLTVTTIYQAVVTNGTCGSVVTTNYTINIAPSSVGGTITPGANTVCAGANGILSLGGKSGNVVQWEYSIDAGNTWNVISNTTTSLSYTAISQTTQYRAAVQNGSCAISYSTIATVTVNPATVAGTISNSGSSPACISNNNGALTLSGNVGNVLKWQSSTDGFITITNIVNTTNTLTYAGLTTTTSYRAQVQSGICAAVFTPATTIAIDAAPVGGTLSGGRIVCVGTATGTLTLSGQSGTITNWEASTDMGNTWGVISNTTPTLSYNNISQTTLYRVVVSNGSCGQTTSSVATVAVAPTIAVISIGGASAVCASNVSVGTIVLNANVGTVTRWEMSTNGGASWTNIANATTSQTYTNNGQTTLYRAFVNTCSPQYSTTVTVYPATIGGSVLGSATVCNGASGMLTLNGQTGNVLNWEASTDGGNNWSPLSNTTASLTYSNIRQTTQYRAVVQNSSNCPPIPSVDATVVVNPTTFGGAVQGGAVVCATGNAGTLTLVNNIGTVQQWEMSVNGGAYAPVVPLNTSTTLTYLNLTQSTQYRVLVQSGNCTVQYSTIAAVAVDAVPVGGTIAGSTSVCGGNNAGVLTLTGHSGTIAHWESSIDGGNNWSVIANTGSSLTYVNVLQTTTYRALLQNGVCAGVYSGIGQVVVTPASYGGNVNGGSVTVCSRSNAGTLSLVGNVGAVLYWETSTDAGGTWVPDNASAGLLNYPYTNVLANTMYRAIVQAGNCNISASFPANVFVAPPVVAGITNNVGATTICSGNNTGTITLSGQSGGHILNWESSADGMSWTSITNTTATLNVTNITQKTMYRAALGNSVCQPAYSTVTTLNVDSQTVAGTVIGSTIVCATNASGTLVLMGKVGKVVSWENSTDGGATWHALPANTSITQSYANITQTTLFRAQVQSGVCNVLPSASATVVVGQASAGGVVLGSDSVCAANNSGVLTLSNPTGNVVQWEYSTDNGLSWTVIANTLPTQSFVNITTTTKYRALVQNGTCPVAYSSVATITVSTPAAQVLLAGAAEVCANSNGGILKGIGLTGVVIRWESSEDGGITWVPIANTTDSLIYTNLPLTTQYSMIVQSGTCPIVHSSIATINVGGAPKAAFSVRGTKAKQPITFTSTSTVKNGIIVQYIWDFGDSAVANGASVVHTYKDYHDYKVSLKITTEKGCTDSIPKTVTIQEPDEFKIANIVTINGNGENDTWYVEGIERHPDSEVSIYNRYGKLIYEKKGYQNDWAGTFDGAPLPDGTYFYVLRLTSTNRTYKGSITLMR